MSPHVKAAKTIAQIAFDKTANADILYRAIEILHARGFNYARLAPIAGDAKAEINEAIEASLKLTNIIDDAKIGSSNGDVETITSLADTVDAEIAWHRNMLYKVIAECNAWTD